MQQPQQMISAMPSFSPTNITTEQIQKYLEENKKLILAILDNQNLGKLAECAQFQAQLQKNLMYLAAIADVQPQTTTMPSQMGQMAPHPVMQQGGFYMPHPQAAAMAQQQGIFPSKMPMQFNNPHQMQEQQLRQQYQHAIQGKMGMRPVGANNGMHTETTVGGGSSDAPPPSAAGLNERGGNKQGGSEAVTTGADGQGGTVTSHGGGDGESSYMKGSKDAK